MERIWRLVPLGSWQRDAHADAAMANRVKNIQRSKNIRGQLSEPLSLKSTRDLPPKELCNACRKTVAVSISLRRASGYVRIWRYPPIGAAASQGYRPLRAILPAARRRHRRACNQRN
jgi:hypothetical protein